MTYFNDYKKVGFCYFDKIVQQNMSNNPVECLLLHNEVEQKLVVERIKIQRNFYYPPNQRNINTTGITSTTEIVFKKVQS